MNENDLIAEYVKENYPELLETYEFAFFRLRKAAEKMRNNIEEVAKEIFDNLKKKLEKTCLFSQKVSGHEKSEETQ